MLLLRFRTNTAPGFPYESSVEIGAFDVDTDRGPDRLTAMDRG